MSKNLYFFCLANMFACAVCNAQPSNEATENGCQKNLRMKIQVLEDRERSTGRTLKLAGYTIADIQQLRIEKGDCQAAQEIDGRIDDESKRK